MTKPVAAAGGPEPKGERIALFRYRLIAEALSPRLTPREPGQLVREIASRLHEFPMGTVSRGTLDRWIRDYRARNLAGLEPQVRADAGVVRRHPELFEEAAALRRERPSVRPTTSPTPSTRVTASASPRARIRGPGVVGR